MTSPRTSEFTEEDVELPSMPEPDVADLEVPESDWPGGVKAVAKLAREHGFDVTVRYSRGPWQDSGKASYTTKRCFGVGGTRRDMPYNASFRATWLSMDREPPKWAFNAAHIAGVFGIQNSKTLRTYITGGAS